MEFADRLLEAINARAEGHKAFARAMKARGVSGHSYRTLRNYLTSATTPSPIWIEEAARELGVRLEWLRDGSGEMLYEEELASTPGPEAVAGSLRGASKETMEILAEVEGIFSSDLGRRDPVYTRLFRQIAVTLASTGSVSLAQLVEVVRDGDRAGAVYETYLTNYASSCRAVLKYVGTAARLLLPQQEGLDEAPLDPVISGMELFALEQLIGLGRLLKDTGIGISIDDIVTRHSSEKEWCVQRMRDVGLLESRRWTEPDENAAGAEA